MKSGCVLASLCACAIGLLASCGEAAENPDASTAQGEDWAQAVDALAQPRSAVYSYRFNDTGGVGLSLALSNLSAEAACAQLGAGKDPGRDTWTLELSTGAVAQGAYDLGSDLTGAAGMMRFEAGLVRRSGSDISALYEPAAGNAVIKEPAQDPLGQADMDVDLDLSFSRRPLSTRQCSGGSSSDGSERDESCKCSAPDQQVFECAPSAPGLSCCRELALESGTGPSLRTSVTAVFCRDWCRFVGSDDSCTELFGPASQPATSSSCANTACAGRLWPRLAVRLLAPDLAQDDVRVTFGDGRVVPSGQPPCPADDADYACDFGVSAGPKEDHVTVEVLYQGEVVAQKDISLAVHNNCGDDIAYVGIDGTRELPEISEATYRSPCATP